MTESTRRLRRPVWQELYAWLVQHRISFYRYVAPVLRRTGLARVVFRAYERTMALGERDRDELAEDGLPVPPARLRVLVYGSPSRADFLLSGRASQEIIERLFDEAGLSLSHCGALLDFGCGCGRILRHWSLRDDITVFGCDYNAELVDWCALNLPRVTVRQNGIAPPTIYEDCQFGAIYAISVFTHLTYELQLAWMQELVRMLRPGGRLLFTTHGTAMLGGLLPDERRRFDSGELVVRFESEAGSNLCNAFQPEPWVREVLAKGLAVDLFRPGGVPTMGDQDIWVVRR